jgi:outer membrane protein, heavy metal efflux system
MRLTHPQIGCLTVLTALIVGCQAPRPSASVARPKAEGAPSRARAVASTVQAVRLGDADSGRLPTHPSPESAAPPSVRFASDPSQVPRLISADDPFAGQAELQLPQLLGEVLGSNRTIQAMRSAWLAAAERYPQARAMEDPVFMSMLAPASLNSGIANTPGNSAGYLVGGSQTLPWFGKRQLRGEAALAESNAARWSVEDARLAIVEAASLAYYDYYLVRQELLLNRQNSAKLSEFREIAARKYEANIAPQQDVLQADVELAELARRQIELERMQRIATARINALMHCPPDTPLPPAPGTLNAAPVLRSAVELRAMALSRRPDLAALGAKVRAEQSRLALANKEFMPDFEIFGRYDNFWSQTSLRGQVGVNMNIPLYRDKRYAAVREAQWRLNQSRAEYEQRIDDINREVQTAYERFDEARQTVALYTEQILPAARKNVESAFAAYETGRGDFLRLVAAQRQLIGLQERHQQAIADYHRRRAELQRVVGQPI